MTTPVRNPYTPPTLQAVGQEPTSLTDLLRQSTNHQLLLLMFAAAYLGSGATALMSNHEMARWLIAGLGLWLVICTWWLLASCYGTRLRLFLSFVALIPVLNLVVPVVNHLRLCVLARDNQIPVSAYGPVTGIIEHRIGEQQHALARRK